MVSPPFPALTVLLTACTGGPMPTCHQPSTTGGTGRRASSHPGRVPRQQHCKVSSMGTRAQVTQPLPSRISKPKPPCNMQGIGSRFALEGPILQGPSRSTLEDCSPALALPARSPRVLEIPWQQHPGTLLPLPARGGLIGMGIFAPGPGPGFILSPDICAMAEHVAFIC